MSARWEILSRRVEDGFDVVTYRNGHRSINGTTFGPSSLSVRELAAIEGLCAMPPLDSPSLPEVQS